MGYGQILGVNRSPYLRGISNSMVAGQPKMYSVGRSIEFQKLAGSIELPKAGSYLVPQGETRAIEASTRTAKVSVAWREQETPLRILEARFQFSQ
jgi:hypothetical protein